MAVKIFGREPALILGVIGAILNAWIGLGLPGMSDQLASALMALVGAAIGAVTALAVRPVPPAVFSGVAVAVAPVLDLVGWAHLTQAQVGLVSTLAMAVVPLLTRAQVTPEADPRPTAVV